MTILTVKNLKKQYKNTCVVDNVDLQVDQGEIVGLLGSNGAGKTTTFHMIVGLIPSHSGSIFFRGTDVSSLPMFKRARIGMSYLPQESSIFVELSVKQNIMMVLEILNYSRKKRAERLEEILNKFRIFHLADQKGCFLSGGERRRLEMARCFARNPFFLMLDEPFSGVDPISISEIKEMLFHLRKEGLTVLFTDHNVRETLSMTDRSYIMHEGKILASGTSQSLLQNSKVQDCYLGKNFNV